MPMRSPTLRPRLSKPRATASQLSLYCRQETSRGSSPTQRSTIAGRSSCRNCAPMVPRFLTIHLDDDLAEHAALFQDAHAFGGLLQRQLALDHRFELTPGDKIQARLDVFRLVGARADDLDLAVPDEADVDGAHVAD